MKPAAFVLFAIVLTVPMAAAAQSLEEIKTLEKFEETLELLDKAEIALESATRARRTDCMKAFGNKAFCTCISDKMAVAWSFHDYVAITTRSKEENGYGNLSNELRIAYDNVAGARDQCVAASIAP